MSPDVRILPTGVANLRSVDSMLIRLVDSVGIASSCSDLLSPVPLVVPGVGSFAAAMAALEDRGWDQFLRDRVRAGLPTLCICLGMQILLEGSEEAPGVPGLGLIPGVAQRFPETLTVPQMGWNGVGNLGDFYFANSYRLAESPPDWESQTSSFGGDFVSFLRRGRVWACQFHPELSGANGQALIRSWLNVAAPDSKPTESALTRRVIPCLDVRDGRIVKGVRFQDLRDAGDPVARAAMYEQQGADELVILDVSATPEGRATGLETIRRVREAIGIPLTVGGGVRTVADAGALLEAGADKVAVNSAAVADPDLLSQLANRFGRQCTVIAIDAKSSGIGWQVVTHSGSRDSGRDAATWAAEAEAHGAGEILLTSWDRDGTGEGYDLPLLSSISQSSRIPLIASGGGANAKDMAAALEAGADAILAASIFHDGVSTPYGIKTELADLGWAVCR